MFCFRDSVLPVDPEDVLCKRLGPFGRFRVCSVEAACELSPVDSPD